VAQLSSEIDTTEQDAIAQLNTVQALYSNATAVNTTAHNVTLQQLQGIYVNFYFTTWHSDILFTDLLDDYLTERTKITNLTAHADSLRNELDWLIANIQESSDTLRECTRTP